MLVPFATLSTIFITAFFSPHEIEDLFSDGLLELGTCKLPLLLLDQAHFDALEWQAVDFLCAGFQLL
jgi:hypothetical protein